MFGIHNHQPVGNFPNVFQRTYEKCYLPFVKMLEKHPGVRVSLHYTGPLLEWIEENRPEYFDRIRGLLSRGQIELLGGGFYEPLLPVIPRVDARGQILLMQEYIADKFGVTPRGMWLAERVWEPGLPSLIAETGLEYVTIDDTHFYYAGMKAEDMSGYYLTEDQGQTVAVFPIDKEMRYRIPFRVAEESINYFKERAEKSPECGITLADDGEKFGEWPGTYKWVYQDGYLESLFRHLEDNSTWLNMLTFSEYLDRYPARGRVYLPTASYDEMMEWSLPVSSQVSFEDLVKECKGRGQYEQLRPYLRGGFWRNFLVKYPEVNQMYSKMIHLSSKVNGKKRNGKKDSQIKRYLYRGQCNCAYWHGLFGGLYLNYLRHAIYQNLIGAENLLSKGVELESKDYNFDGQKEILASVPKYNIYLSPAAGGQIIELDYKPKQFNLSNVLARRPEAYHQRIDIENEEESAGEPQSIHDIVRTKEDGLKDILFYDWYPRYGLIDHFLAPDTTLEKFSRCHYGEEGDFVNQPYKVEECSKGKSSLKVTLSREGTVYINGKGYPLEVTKSLTMGKKIEVEYSLINLSNDCLNIWWGVEFNLTLLAGNEKQRFYLLPEKGSQKQPLCTRKSNTGITKLALADTHRGFRLACQWSRPATLWRFPVETVSQSEDGLEKTYQGSCIMPSWKLSLPANSNYSLQLTIEISG